MSQTKQFNTTKLGILTLLSKYIHLRTEVSYRGPITFLDQSLDIPDFASPRNVVLTIARVKLAVKTYLEIDALQLDNSDPRATYEKLLLILNTVCEQNKKLGIHYGKFHTSFAEAKEQTGVALTAFFKRSLFQSNANTAYERAVQICKKAINKADHCSTSEVAPPSYFLPGPKPYYDSAAAKTSSTEPLLSDSEQKQNVCQATFTGLSSQGNRI